MQNVSRSLAYTKWIIGLGFSLTAFTGVLVLIGWQYDVLSLKQVFPGFVSMKANTAVGLLSFAMSGLFLFLEGKIKNARVIAGALSSFAFLIGFATIMEYAFSLNLGIDELLYKDYEAVGKSSPPGRLAPITAISFFLLGCSVYFGFFKKKPLYKISQTFLFIVTLISFQALVSYSLGLKFTFGIASHTRIAVHTASALFFLCISFLYMTGSNGFMKLLLADTLSAMTARRLIFAALFVPPFVQAVEQFGIQIGFYESDFGTLLRVVGSMIFFVFMVLHNANDLNRTEVEREKAREDLIEREKQNSKLLADKEAAAIREANEAILREELITARNKAEKAVEVKSEFLANMSHELRTPLNGVVGITNLLAGTSLNELQKKYVRTLVDSAQLLLTVINEVLDFSKIEAGKIELEKVDFNLKNIIQTQLNLVTESAQEKGLNLSCEVDASIPYFVVGDSGRINQIILNFLTNAIKFTEKGSIHLTAKIEETYENGSIGVGIAVRDTGIGISDEIQKKLFQAFTQADNSTSRKFGGTGLGLSICKSLVELMNGQIGIISRPNEGSTFWFKIPLEKSTQRTIDPFEKDFPALERAIDFTEWKGLRVLVAEDNVVNQMVVLAHLDKLGLEAQAVANGQEVLNALELAAFDLILMDCQMPEMDGFQATRLIREKEKASASRIPIIALTANAMSHDKEKCLEAGMDAYLTKPLREDHLLQLLEKWLRVDKIAS